jgi:hypothetical protein
LRLLIQTFGMHSSTTGLMVGSIGFWPMWGWSEFRGGVPIAPEPLS